MHVTSRRAIAALVGVSFEVLFFWKFLPYSVRERHEIIPVWGAFLLSFVAGLLLNYGSGEVGMQIQLWILAGFGLSNALLIVVDCLSDPTNHNLFPFEFIFIAILTAPAFLGAALSRRFERSNANNPTNQ